MNRTTPRPALLAALLALTLLAGATAAAAEGEPTPPAPPHEKHDKPGPQRDHAGLRLKAEPGALWVKPGGTATFRLHAEARDGAAAMRVDLAETPRGLHVKMGADLLQPGKPLEVTVAADEGIEKGPRVLRLMASATGGDATAETRLVVHVGERPHERPDEKRPDGKPAPRHPGTQPPRAGFALRIEPEVRHARPGETLTLTVYAHAPARDATVELGLQHVPDGYEASLSPTTLTLKAGERAKAELTVLVPNGTQGGTLVVQARSAEGNATAMAKARIEVGRPGPRPMPPAAEDDVTRDEAERYPLAREARPQGHGAGFRMHLFPQDALVGPEGGRAVVLLQGGEADQVVKLGVRHDPASGWRVLVRDHVKLPAHGTAWAWVVLQPPAEGADKAPLKYELYAASPRGHLVAHGSAQVEA